MTRLFKWLAQGLLYGLFALTIGTFSGWPRYRHLASDEALIRVSFSLEGKRESACHRRSPEELAKLAPNMRMALDCPRRRSPVTVAVDIDGKPVFNRVAMPSGLSGDGASNVYQRFAVPAGEHRLAVRLKNDVNSAGFDYQRETRVDLKPGQVLVIDFDAEKGGITLK
ncbi:hypothetical protein GALL_258020 [mine drainage metagenome]|uniref:Uncharacterized protein n=1 Tax=mine drainage metagenome TaxID=410659 RepID=A0A1J5R8D6_9ZZZZ